MTTTAAPGTLVPEVNDFAARLALVRHSLGAWNVSKAARFCGLDDESWRKWEQGRLPQHYEKVCRQISAATGYSLVWLMTGLPRLDSNQEPAGIAAGVLAAA